MSLAAVGIGAGCYLAGVLSRRDVGLGLVPYGGITTDDVAGDIRFDAHHGVTFGVLVFLAAFFSGMFKVPLDAWIQRT